MWFEVSMERKRNERLSGEKRKEKRKRKKKYLLQGFCMVTLTQ
jgi:hypothetical protein